MKNKKNGEFLLWNMTDNVSAAPDLFPTMSAARRYALKFRARFAAQGYYLTADRLRIDPEDIELEVITPEELATGRRSR